MGSFDEGAIRAARRISDVREMFHQRSGPRVSLGEVDRGGGGLSSAVRFKRAVRARRARPHGGGYTCSGVWKIMRKILLSRPRAKECAKNRIQR